MKKLWILILVCMASASFATVHVVNVNGASFSPADVTVSEGDTIRWVKPAGGFHNVAEVSNPPFFRSGNATNSAFTYDFPVPLGSAGTYDYECEVHGPSGMTGSVTVESGGTAPGQPSNPDPSDNETGVPTFYLLSWTAADGADHYIVRFGTVNPPPVANPELEGTLWGPPLMNENTVYFWQITGVNDFGQTDGPVWRFTTEGGLTLPDAPTYVAPTDGATEVSSSGTLIWNAADGADSYSVQLGTTNPPPVVHGDVLDTEYAFSDLEPETQYFWRVSSVNALGQTPGAIWSFTTAAAGTPPDAPTYIAPTDAATNVPRQGFLIWNAANGAESYSVQFGTTNPPSTANDNFIGTQFSYSDLSASTQYFWRITSLNEFGDASGPVWSFTTEAESDAGEHPVPTAFQLGAAYPNPFNSNVRVSLNIPAESFTTARVFDITGREVSTLINGKLGAGEHQLEWNASGQSAGLYFLKCECAGITQTQKLVYMP